MIVVGVGGTDTLSQAEDFAARYGGPPNLLWSSDLTAWRHYRSGNPQAVLLDPSGADEITRQAGFSGRRFEEALARLN